MEITSIEKRNLKQISDSKWSQMWLFSCITRHSNTDLTGFAVLIACWPDGKSVTTIKNKRVIEAMKNSKYIDFVHFSRCVWSETIFLSYKSIDLLFYKVISFEIDSFESNRLWMRSPLKMMWMHLSILFIIQIMPRTLHVRNVNEPLEKNMGEPKWCNNLWRS